jgi:hypothetical protein
MDKVTIEAKQEWNSTSYQLIAGKKYRFYASGKWVDWFISTDATGYSSFWLKPFEGMRRLPLAKWFSVIGAIDRQESTLFDIGKLIETHEFYTSPMDGELSCFANDLACAYKNNQGSIELIIAILIEGK